MDRNIDKKSRKKSQHIQSISFDDLKSYKGEELGDLDKLAPILIIDDNVVNLTSLQTMIGYRFGLAASICSSGYLALRFLKEKINLMKERNKKNRV